MKKYNNSLDVSSQVWCKIFHKEIQLQPDLDNSNYVSSLILSKALHEEVQ